MPIEDDIDLVRRVEGLEPTALDEFVHRSESIFMGVAKGGYRLHRDQVDDLYQRFILSLIDNGYRKLFQWSKESPLDAYLRKIAKNQCIDYFRSMGREWEREEFQEDGVDPLSAIPDGNPGPYDSVNTLGKKECFRKAMAELTDRDQSLVELWGLGYSYKLIAEKLDITANNAGVALKRAIERLQRALRRLCPDYMDRNEL